MKGFIPLDSKIMMYVNQNPLDNVYFLFLKKTNLFTKAPSHAQPKTTSLNHSSTKAPRQSCIPDDSD
jgi:hypothetical protein